MGETPFGWYFKNIFNNFPELISTTEEIKPSKIKTFKNCEISALFGEKTYFLDAFDALFSAFLSAILAYLFACLICLFYSLIAYFSAFLDDHFFVDFT